ncbi:hypothetical protein HYW41_01515 [Candidatus Daviesbacteria bacterium]|nr:hypothetical protein [Candidatus Daviesbacteria bacterium]
MATVEFVGLRGIDRSPRIPSKRYPLTHTHGGFDYVAYKVTRENKLSLRIRALPFEKEFGYADPFLIHDKVRSYIKEGGEVEFARTRGVYAKDVAIVTQDVRRVPADDQRIVVLCPGIRVVFPEYQRFGIATHFAGEAITRHSPDLVVGKTRTWRIPRMYRDTGLISSIHPIDAPFTPEMQGVLRLILDRSTLFATDLRTGVCFGIYPPEESSRFIPPGTNVKGVEIDRRIRELGAQPEKGDGIVYCAVVNQDAVQAQIDSRYFDQSSITSVQPTPRGLLKRIGSVLDTLRVR